MEFLKKRIFLLIILAGIIYLGFSVYADFEKLVISFSNFNFVYLPLILLLSVFNYIFRFYKWNYYLRIIKVELSIKDSVIVFLSGFLMSITPGKFGEIFKSYLIKKINGTSISKTAPVVLAERITDFLSLAVLALVGSYFFNYGFIISLLMTLALTLIIILITNRNLFDNFLRFTSKINFLKEKSSKFKELYESTESLLKLKPLIYALIVSIISWGFECIGYYIVILNFTDNVSLYWSAFSYSFSTIVGAISMLPGGLVVTEGSMLIMLNNIGLKLSDSTATTFIIRTATLWFAVVIGIFAFMIFSYRFGKVELVDEKIEK